MRILVQLYEVQEPREAEQLIELGVDHIGSVVLSPWEWKNPTLRDVVRLVNDSPSQSSLILLLKDEEDILRALDYYEPAIVHFCDAIPLGPAEEKRRQEVVGRLLEIQKRVKKEFPPFLITRSLPVPLPGSDPLLGQGLLDLAEAFAPCTDFFMTDTVLSAGEHAAQPVEGFVGITGMVCDWTLSASLVTKSQRPVILGGGISPENAVEAIRRVRPAGIDSCTHTNARDSLGRSIRFRKDLDRVRRLLDAVRQAEEEL